MTEKAPLTDEDRRTVALSLAVQATAACDNDRVDTLRWAASFEHYLKTGESRAAVP